MKEVQVFVVNRGFVFMVIFKVSIFVLFFYVSFYFLQEGFLKGGFALIINGGGFNVDIVVIIDVIICEIISVTYNIIICVVFFFNIYSFKVLVVKVFSNGNNLEVKCFDFLFSCFIRYVQVFIFIVILVILDFVFGFFIMLIIVGILFGIILLGVIVIIGGVLCIVFLVIDIQIQCIVGIVFVGF